MLIMVEARPWERLAEREALVTQNVIIIITIVIGIIAFVSLQTETVGGKVDAKAAIVRMDRMKGTIWWDQSGNS